MRVNVLQRENYTRECPFQNFGISVYGRVTVWVGHTTIRNRKPSMLATKAICDQPLTSLHFHSSYSINAHVCMCLAAILVENGPRRQFPRLAVAEIVGRRSLMLLPTCSRGCNACGFLKNGANREPSFHVCMDTYLGDGTDELPRGPLG